MTQITSLFIVIILCCVKSLFAEIVAISDKFTENGAEKALIYPNKTERRLLRTDAIELCAQNNAKLVDIESAAKQEIVLTFLHRLLIYHQTGGNVHYWIGGYYNAGKYWWQNSGHEFNYTNWVYTGGHPRGESAPYIVIIGDFYYIESDGGWMTVFTNTTANVVCERIY